MDVSPARPMLPACQYSLVASVVNFSTHQSFLQPCQVENQTGLLSSKVRDTQLLTFMVVQELAFGHGGKLKLSPCIFGTAVQNLQALLPHIILENANAKTKLE